MLKSSNGIDELGKVFTMVRSIKGYLYTWALTTVWINIVCATRKHQKAQKRLLLVNNTAAGQG